MSRMSLIQGDIMHIPLDDKSVQCCICSPPYWGLRSYHTGDQKEFELGGEKLHDCLGWATGNMCGECYICHVRMYAQEIHRVLRDDGTWWLNLGDSYASSTKGSGGPSDKQDSNAGSRYEPRQYDLDGLKPKDLCGIPWRVALALQADGWYLRSDIIWAKPNPMPESVTDRPTKAHEYLFLLSKDKRYFYDADAVREESNDDRVGTVQPAWKDKIINDIGAMNHNTRVGLMREREYKAFRNRRTVWTVATQPYAGSHFATFPAKLVEPCIKAGTSERGCCPVCGKQWVRVVERKGYNKDGWGAAKKDHTGNISGSQSMIRNGNGRAGSVKVDTLGFRPDCDHDAEPVPCTVFDPFAGSGTTVMVANQLGRRGIGLELSSKYIDLSRDRLQIKALEEWENGVDGTQTELSDLPMFSNL